MAYCIDSSPSTGEPGEIHATPRNSPGVIRDFSDGHQYVYLRGAAGVTRANPPDIGAYEV